MSQNAIATQVIFRRKMPLRGCQESTAFAKKNVGIGCIIRQRMAGRQILFGVANRHFFI
jgi:hypothetical protein